MFRPSKREDMFYTVPVSDLAIIGFKAVVHCEVDHNVESVFTFSSCVDVCIVTSNRFTCK